MDSDLQARLATALAPAYEVEGELGRGGMAIVYRARDTRLKRPVAIKLLPPELAFRGDIRSRFMREAETAARLNHPNIVPIYSVDEREGMVYFVMALIQGESVGDRVRRAGPLPITEARRILREIADALAYAHTHGVVHRDIKPDNVLLDAASGRAMVTDFGIARAASDDDAGGSRLTATGAVVGTPSYMSPEQCSGDREIDGRSDLYSLGTVAYQMLTGEPPFIGGNAPSIMMKQVTEPALPIRQRRGDVPEDLDRIVMRLLAKAPGDRFDNGAALVAALDGAPVTPVPPRRWVSPGMRDVPPAVSRALGRFGNARVGIFPEQYREKLIQDVQERLLSRREERDLRRAKKRGEDRPLPERLRRFRGRLVGYAGTSLFMFGINYMTMGPGDHFWWFVFPVFGIGLGVTRELGRLLGDGVPFSSVLSGTVPPELAAASAASVAVAPGAPAATRLAPVAADANDEVRKGPYGAVLVQAMTDRQTVNDLFGCLSDTERKMLPDVKETADALFARVVALASALQRLGAEVSPDRLMTLDTRIADIERQSGDAGDRERRLNLLRRQRDMLAELVRSRATLLEQYESAGLLLQNLALDLLKVRSSGLDSAINGLTSATQEARALSREIGYVLNAADELRNLGKRV
jgi:serine/threonine protein kinase